MTFDEALDHLYTYSSTRGSGQTTQAQHEEAKKVAIAIMRKYQKIQKIANEEPRLLSMRLIVDYLLMNIHHASNAPTMCLKVSMRFLISTRQKARKRYD